jgi:hypothetical protein
MVYMLQTGALSSYTKILTRTATGYYIDNRYLGSVKLRNIA